MNTKHTPGLWHWNEEEGTIVNFGGMVIADVRELRHENTSDVEDANARLIAAAPELLVALKDLIKCGIVQMAEHGTTAGISELASAAKKARAAIAKATDTTNL